jgi:signal transduction histidine kinase
MLRPLGMAVIVVVVAGSVGTRPAPGLHGKAVGVTIALCAFGVALALAIRDLFTELAYALQALVIAAMGAAGVTLVALQPRTATGLAGGAAVRMAPAEAILALYRGAQEALTNVARYAPGALPRFSLRYYAERTTLTVENGALNAGTTGAADRGLAGVGGGRGLAGMRERIERAGGSMRAGPTGGGWRVELEVPA